MKTGKSSTSNPADEWLLPFNRSFVIQIETRSRVSAKLFRGRVEHMASGRVTHFHSIKELLGFLTDNLNEEMNDLSQKN